jgi:hypothetical protein
MDMNGDLVAPGPASDWASLPTELLTCVAGIITESEYSLSSALSVCPNWNQQMMKAIARLQVTNYAPEQSSYRLFRDVEHLRWRFAKRMPFHLPSVYAAPFTAPVLKTLDIDEPYTDDAVANIVDGVAPFDRLQCLRITGAYWISDRGYEQLSRLTSLTTLRITGANIFNDVSAGHLARLSNITV